MDLSFGLHNDIWNCSITLIECGGRLIEVKEHCCDKIYCSNMNSYTQWAGSIRYSSKGGGVLIQLIKVCIYCTKTMACMHVLWFSVCNNNTLNYTVLHAALRYRSNANQTYLKYIPASYTPCMFLSVPQLSGVSASCWHKGVKIILQFLCWHYSCMGMWQFSWLCILLTITVQYCDY